MKNKIFFKYILFALISFLIDILFFTIFNIIFNNKIILATILARIISSFINYLLNKNIVFKSKEKTVTTIIKYYCLVIVQMLISALLVKYIYNVVTINASIIKVPVDLIIFICNYLIQKIFIFKERDK